MSILTVLTKALWLTEKDPDQWRLFWWRLLVSSAITFGCIFVLWSMGGIWGTQGFALAEDIETQISLALQPMNDRLRTIEDEQTTQSGYLKRLVRSDLERLIDREILARCNADSSAEKQRIKSAIGSYQDDYKAVFGAEYDEPECAEL